MMKSLWNINITDISESGSQTGGSESDVWLWGLRRPSSLRPSSTRPSRHRCPSCLASIHSCNTATPSTPSSCLSTINSLHSLPYKIWYEACSRWCPTTPPPPHHWNKQTFTPPMPPCCSVRGGEWPWVIIIKTQQMLNFILLLSCAKEIYSGACGGLPPGWTFCHSMDMSMASLLCGSGYD